jgi:transcription elongation factor GreA
MNTPFSSPPQRIAIGNDGTRIPPLSGLSRLSPTCYLYCPVNLKTRAESVRVNLFSYFIMIQEMREKLSKEVEQLSHELNVLLPQAIATAVEMGDLRENSEYKAALERQQLVQARLGQLHQRLSQLSEMTGHSPLDRVGLGSKITVQDLATDETETYVLVLGEMADFELGHISVASPLGRALKDGRMGDEVDLRLPNGARRLRIVQLVTANQLQ